MKYTNTQMYFLVLTESDKRFPESDLVLKNKFICLVKPLLRKKCVFAMKREKIVLALKCIKNQLNCDNKNLILKFM